jgi:hypothetical protein
MEVMTIMKPRPKRSEATQLPARWSIQDVRAITGVEIVDVRILNKWVVCTLLSGMDFWIKKW